MTIRSGMGFISLAILLALGGCNPAPGSGLHHETGNMYRLSPDRPHTFLNALEFKGELLWPESLYLEKPSSLEFLPLAYGEEKEDARLELYYIEEGKVTPLSSCTPCFLGSEEFQGAGRLALLDKTVLVDLSPLTGRRVALKWILNDRGSSLEGAIGTLKIFPEDGAGPERPNILFICSDTHRHDFAFGGEGRRLMPALNDLKKSAKVYHHAFSNASWTMPSIASVMTGLFPRYHLTGFRAGSVDANAFDPGALPPGQFGFKTGKTVNLLTCYPEGLVTLTEHLRGQGYTTAMVASNPLYMLSGLFADGQDVVVNTGVVDGGEVNDSAFRLIENRPKSRPLFLLVHYMDVHQWIPWYLKKSHPDLSPREDREKSLAAYRQAVRDTDSHLAALLKKWRAKIGLENSMVVFYSDHGEHLLDPGTNLVGHGNSMNEALLHVPLLIHYPTTLGIEAGDVEVPVSLVDLHATVLDMLGVLPVSDSRRGASLLRPDGSGSRLLFADSQLYGEELSSIREGPFKLVLHFDTDTSRLIDCSSPFTESGEEGQRTDNESVRAKLKKGFFDYLEDGKEKTKGLKSTRKVDPDEALDSMNQLGYTR